MVLLQALLTAASRSAGKALNTAFGWATMMLFGKVPDDKQIYLSVISFGSVLWLVALIGVAVPGAATWLLGFITLPEWVQDGWIRLAMLAAVAILPLVIGAVSLVMVDAEDRPKTLGGKAKMVLRGYPFALGLAITLVMMTLFAPVMKARNIIRRWTSEHVAIMVEPQDYLAVVADVQAALAKGGLETRRELATWMLRFPTRVLTFFGGGAVENLAADQLTTLKSEKIEVLLHPSDMVVSGRQLEAARAHAVITEQLTFTRAYMTWTKEANQVEDKLRGIWRGIQAGKPGELAQLGAIEKELSTLKVSYEEWETLFREKLQVERGLLQVMAGVTDRPRDLTEASPEQNASARQSAPAPAPASGTTVVTLPVPSRLLPPAIAGTTALLAFLALAWERLRGRRGAFG